MKRIVSVSIGSSLRDKCVELDLLGDRYRIERIGTDGNVKKAIEWIRELDGRVDVFGMGGIDLYITSGDKRRYIIREAIPIRGAAKHTPIVDGTGVKNTLEKKVLQYLKDRKVLDFDRKRVLLTCAADRYAMAEAFYENGCEVVIGDLMFALGLPVPIHKLETFRRIADAAIPIITRLPFELLYPTGDKQKKISSGRFAAYYQNADIIAGDFHYIKKYLPDQLKGKTIITNTITDEDVKMLKERGTRLLVTSTPNLEGRSFGTNVMEALLVSVSGKKPEDIGEAEYYELLDRMGLEPRIEYLN
jgi:hypothetical protein